MIDPVNGIDGERDVLIDGDRIARVGRDLPVNGATVVEITSGLVVCPGFIDMRAPARARSGAQGDRCDRHGVRGRRRVHRRACMQTRRQSTTMPTSPR